MTETYNINCEKYKKFKNLKILYIWNRTLVISISCAKCDSDNDKIFKEYVETLKDLELINNIIE